MALNTINYFLAVAGRMFHRCNTSRFLNQECSSCFCITNIIFRELRLPVIGSGMGPFAPTPCSSAQSRYTPPLLLAWGAFNRVAFQDRSRPVASAASVIGWETRPVLILATGRGFATRPWLQPCLRVGWSNACINESHASTFARRFCTLITVVIMFTYWCDRCAMVFVYVCCRMP